MKFILSFLLIIISKSGICQEVIEYAPDAFDQLGLKVKIVNKVTCDKCGCEFGDERKKQCVLYQAKVDSLLFVRKSLDTIPDISTSMDVFLLMPYIEDKFKPGDVYNVMAYMSYYDYLIVNKIFCRDIHFLEESGDYISLSGPCYKMNFFDKLFSQLGFRKNKEFKILKKDENIFWAKIHQLH